MSQVLNIGSLYPRRLENNLAAIAFHFMYHNFCCVNKSSRTAPAMKAGISDHLWTIQELVALLEP